MSTHTISTRPEKNAAEQQTKLTIDWTGCDEKVLQAYATQALIVKLQSGFRKNGIPKELTVKAAEYAPGTRHVGGGQFSVSKFDPANYTEEQLEELRKKLGEKRSSEKPAHQPQQKKAA